MVNKRGHIVIEHGANPKPHEIRTAQSLAAAGYTITLVAKSEIDGVKTADARMNGETWEMKAPTSDSKKAIQKNMHKALKQSRNLIIDSRRMNIPGYAIEQEVRSLAPKLRSLKKLLLINKLGEVIEIK